MIEYVLIPSVNDTVEHADQLASFLELLRCSINVIPYNPRRHSPWAAPNEETIWQFVNHLRERGCFVKRRRTLGRSIMAACGQLGNEHVRRQTSSRAALRVTVQA
jgi:23S rRNA (adenine2503-C2)-methyltransferase